MKTEAERTEEFRKATAHLPSLPAGMVARTWTDQETEALRKACARRFGEDVRTETLYTIAAVAMRIALSWSESEGREP